MPPSAYISCADDIDCLIDVHTQALRNNPLTTPIADLLRTSGIDLSALRADAKDVKITVFAPNGTSIARLEAKEHVTPPQLAKALQTPAGQRFLLTQIYNKSAVNSSQLKNGEVLTMASGVNVTVRKFPSGRLELIAPGSRSIVTRPNIRVGNSIIHIIDLPLFPVNNTKYKAAQAAKANATG